MVSTAKLPKHVLSIRNWKAKRNWKCIWCGDGIAKGRVYVRCVWENDEGDVLSDHICVSCWEKD